MMMIAEQFPWLTAIILLPLVSSLLIPVLPVKEGKQVRWYAIGVAIADFVLTAAESAADEALITDGGSTKLQIVSYGTCHNYGSDSCPRVLKRFLSHKIAQYCKICPSIA